MSPLLSQHQKTLLLAIFLLDVVIPSRGQVTFSAPLSYTVGTNPGNIVTVDLNGDGIPDLAVANNGDPVVNDQGSVSVLLGKGDGTFQPTLDVPAGAFPAIIISGDFNGDGKLDLFVEGEPSGNTTVAPWSILLGHGDGSFGAPAQFALVNFTGSIVVADFNNDKKLDLIFIDQASIDVLEELGNGDGTFQPPQSRGTAPGPFLTTGDFNGDGNVDLAIGPPLSPSTFRGELWLGNGDGTFQPFPSQSFTPTGSLLAYDINGDGRTDLFTAAELTGRIHCGIFNIGSEADYYLVALLANSDGSFQPGQQIASSSTTTCGPTGASIRVAAFGDFDGDGKVDVAVDSTDVKTGAHTLHVLGGRGNATFPTDLATVNGFFNVNPATVDLNGDRLADLGAQSSPPNTIKVVVNTTKGYWLEAPASLGPVKAGASANGTITIKPQNGFANPVSLSCSVATSLGIHCSLSVSTVTPGASSTLTLTTTGNSAISRSLGSRFRPEWLYALFLPVGGILFQSLGLRQSAKKTVFCVAFGCVLLLGIVFQTACGNAGAPPSRGTPAGTYGITVTGASGATAHSATVMLTVQ